MQCRKATVNSDGKRARGGRTRGWMHAFVHNYISGKILLYAQREIKVHVWGRTRKGGLSCAALWVDKSYLVCNYVISTTYPLGLWI